MKIKERQEAILKLLSEQYSGGLVTEQIANHFKLTNRQVGGIMSQLIKDGKVRSYTKGYIMYKSCSNANTAPMGLLNSFYEIL